LFLEHGYQGTTVRAIAASAGVDSALISYHFGSKQGLFGQSLKPAVPGVQCWTAHCRRPGRLADRC